MDTHRLAQESSPEERITVPEQVVRVLLIVLGVAYSFVLLT